MNDEGMDRAGPEKYWPTSKRIFLAFLFLKTVKILKVVAEKTWTQVHSHKYNNVTNRTTCFLWLYLAPKIYIFLSGPKHMLDGLLFRPGPGYGPIWVSLFLASRPCYWWWIGMFVEVSLVQVHLQAEKWCHCPTNQAKHPARYPQPNILCLNP